MSLQYRAIDGSSIDLVATAIQRIREFAPNEGYYVAFSGGKDSIVILDLVRRAGVKHDVHFHITTVDPPELIRFLREHYPDISMDHPKISMFRLIEKKKIPPTRRIRYCCSDLKESGGKGRFVVTGIRWAESAKRSRRMMTERCLRDPSQTFLHPIIEWSDEDVWEYIRSRDLAYPSLYDEGFKRIGCIMCPLQGEAGMRRDAERWPRTYRAYLLAFGRMLKASDAKGIVSKNGWKTPEDVMHWWITGKKPDHETAQAFLGDAPVGRYDDAEAAT